MMSVREISQVLQASHIGGDAWCTGVSTDSRVVSQGDLFVALTGEKFDGNRFVGDAARQGAVAAMVSRHPLSSDAPSSIPSIMVNDTRWGLGALAAHWRSRFTMPLVAITGSNGKTTVKEMVAAILQQADQGAGGSVLATTGNLNNDIGVPRMLLQLREHHTCAVIEMGMNHAGEIAGLSQMAKPDVAVITNAGPAHLEGLGSLDAVARAKGEIFEGLGEQGVAVINADDAFAPLWRQLAGRRRIVGFGLDNPAQISGHCRLHPFGSKLRLDLPDGAKEVTLQVPGEHNARNALAAAAVAVALGVSGTVIAAGLSGFTGVSGRLQKKPCLNDAILIDDTYNANPASMRAALAVLAGMPGKKILVLGDMGELGAGAVDLHAHIGKEARLAGIDSLFAMGQLSAHAVQEFGAGARHFEEIGPLLDALREVLAADVALLVKGSRFMQMERVVRGVGL